MSDILGKFKATIIYVIIAIIAFTMLLVWVDNQKTQAIDSYKLKIEVAVNNQVKKDVEIINNTFSNPSPAVRSRADRWVQQQSVETSGNNKLRGAEGDSTTSRTEGRSSETFNLCGQCLLLDSEIIFIRKHSELLQ